jgi:hypothetical protein
MRTGFTAILMAAVPSLVLAAETKSTLESVSVGSHVFGPKLNVEDLKGRVVLIEFWGRN